MSRWATFDCYGTLIDWNAGIRGVLEGFFGAERAPGLLARYHALEPEVQAETYRSYAEVLTITLERLATEAGLSIPEGETGALAQSLPDWPPFTEVPRALTELRDRGWNLAILSNTDHALHHGVAEDARRSVRHRRHGRGRRLVQAGARTLGALLRADDRRSRAPRPRRREPLPRRRARARARAEDRLDQPARRGRRPRARPRAARSRDAAGHARGARRMTAELRVAAPEDAGPRSGAPERDRDRAVRRARRLGRGASPLPRHADARGRGRRARRPDRRLRGPRREEVRDRCWLDVRVHDGEAELAARAAARHRAASSARRRPRRPRDDLRRERRRHGARRCRGGRTIA